MTSGSAKTSTHEAPRHLNYLIDTMRGQSGAPFIAASPKVYLLSEVMVGVHTSGTFNTNGATRN